MSVIKIIKLGGSVVSREDVLFDFDYLKKLRKIIEQRISQQEKFCLILGGGYLMRKYRDLAINEGGISKIEDLHWIGTTVNVLHAEITRAIFSDIAESRPMVYEDYYKEEPVKMDQPVLIGGGGRAGHSGDVDAILLAKKVGSDTVVSLKNIDYLYSADPKKDKNAKIVKKATWDEYFEIINWVDKHEPGGNYVVDPIASKMAKESNIRFVILKGDDLENIQNYLEGEEYIGSEIY